MYRYLIEIGEYTDNWMGFAAVMVGILIAVAIYTLLLNPLHNRVKYIVAAKCGADNVYDHRFYSMSMRYNFNLIGFITCLLLNINFSQPVHYETERLRRPKLHTILISLSGFLTYGVYFLVSAVIYSVLKFGDFFPINSASVVPYQADYKTYICYALFVAVFFIYRISICSIFFNIIPLGPLDMADVLYDFLPINWVDGLRNNVSLLSLILFVFAFLVVGGPDGVINVVGNSTMLGFSNWLREVFYSVF